MKKIHLIKTFTDAQGGYAVEEITSFNTLRALKVNLRKRCAELYTDQNTRPGAVFLTKHNPLRFATESGKEALHSIRHVKAVEIWFQPQDGNPDCGSEIYLAVSTKYLKHFKKKNQEYLKELRKYANAA